MQQFQWFPGHMTKALKEIESRIKVIDVLIEVVDARAPYSSRNPEIMKLTMKAPRLIVMAKKDMADEKIVRKWQDYFKKNSIASVSMNLNKDNMTIITRKCMELLKEKFEKEAIKGLRPRAIRAMIVGIPNVGKSTFINRMANRRAATVGNKPGVTKAQQWIKVNKDFELLDTPGVLWPKFDDPEIGLKLAMIGTIKNEILPKEKLGFEILKFLSLNFPNSLQEKFDVLFKESFDENSALMIYEQIAKRRGMLTSQGKIDVEAATNLLIRDFKDGNILSFCLEKPEI